MDFEDKVKILRSFPVFKVVPITDVRAMAFAARIHKIKAKTILIEEGQSPAAVYFVVDGSFRIYKITEDGEEINLSFAKRGDIIGEMAFINSSTRSAFVEAINDSEVLSLTGADFIKFLRVYPDTALGVLSHLAEKVKKADKNISDIITKSLKQRVFETIVMLSSYFNGGEIVMSQEELAKILGASRSKVSGALLEIETDGKISLSHRKIRLV